MSENKDGIRYPSIDQLTEKTNSKYKLVVAAAKRAKELEAGNEPLISNPRSKKPLGVALEEIINDKIVIVEPKDNSLSNE